MGLFHSSSDNNESIDRFMMAVKEEFVNKCDAIHDSLQAEIKQLAEECEEPAVRVFLRPLLLCELTQK